MLIDSQGTCKHLREILVQAPRAIFSSHADARLHPRSPSFFVRGCDLVRFQGEVELIIRTPDQCRRISDGVARASRAGWQGPALLTFAQCELGEHGAMMLPALLSNCTRLQHLSLAGAYIGSAGAGCLGKVLRMMTEMTSLDLSLNEIDCQGVRRLGASLASLPSLTALELSGNDIGAAGAD
jgi:hypothetical protein